MTEIEHLKWLEKLHNTEKDHLKWLDRLHNDLMIVCYLLGGILGVLIALSWHVTGQSFFGISF